MTGACSAVPGPVGPVNERDRRRERRHWPSVHDGGVARQRHNVQPLPDGLGRLIAYLAAPAPLPGRATQRRPPATHGYRRPWSSSSTAHDLHSTRTGQC